MDLWSLMAIAVAVAMDAFAVAIVAGLSIVPLTKRHVFRLAFHFGLFQAMMPSIGWVAGHAVHKNIPAFDNWAAFGLLAFVGCKMIWGARPQESEAHRSSYDPTSGWNLVMLSFATSVDALAVGLSLAFISSGIVMPALIIGLVAAAFTCTGMLLGRQLGLRWGKRVEIVGGLILIVIGMRILVEHMAL